MQTRACEFQGSKKVTFHSILRKYEKGDPIPKNKSKKTQTNKKQKKRFVDSDSGMVNMLLCSYLMWIFFILVNAVKIPFRNTCW